MNVDNIKNDLFELCLFTQTYPLGTELTPDQERRISELSEHIKTVASNGYVISGQRLFTGEQQS